MHAGTAAKCLSQPSRRRAMGRMDAEHTPTFTANTVCVCGMCGIAEYKTGEGVNLHQHLTEYRPPSAIRGEGGTRGWVLCVSRFVPPLCGPSPAAGRDAYRPQPSSTSTNPRLSLGLGHLTLRIDDYLREEPSDPDSEILWLRKFCSSVKGSVVVLMPGPNCFAVAVGLLGQYLAMVNVPARTESFPNEGPYAWGHLLTIADKKLKRCSWMEGLRQWVGISE